MKRVGERRKALMGTEEACEEALKKLEKHLASFITAHKKLAVDFFKPALSMYLGTADCLLGRSLTELAGLKVGRAACGGWAAAPCSGRVCPTLQRCRWGWRACRCCCPLAGSSASPPSMPPKLTSCQLWAGVPPCPLADLQPLASIPCLTADAILPTRRCPRCAAGVHQA